ncbi:MAG: phytanoyl-CoA dioxygenase family protein [Myxococcales bacterium]|nr:phytanoyl-CoA dioxygenase family protein [Myxococcales bacterium]
MRTSTPSMLAPDVSTTARLEDLGSTGYVVVRSFLTDAEIARFEADYAAAAARGDTSYEVRQVSDEARSVIDDKLAAMARAVEAASSVRVNLVASGVFGSAYFTTEGEVGTAWHQDAVSYFAYQNHHDYLNFYMPIIKPVREKSNLRLIPFDAFAARSPELASRLRGRGATRFAVKDGVTTVHDNNAGGIHGVLPYALDDLSVTPQLDRGDLLLIRGDVIHRTEDKDTRRVAVSIRMMNRQTRVRRAELVRGGFLKAMVMTHGRRDFKPLFDCFAAAGKDELTIGEMAELDARRARPARPTSHVSFMAFLMWNRMRERLAPRSKGVRR